MSLYERLNLGPSASMQDIEKQYLILIKHISEKDITRRLQIYEAYRILIDPNARHAYDFELLKQKINQTTPLLRQIDDNSQTDPVGLYKEVSSAKTLHEEPPSASNRRSYQRIPCPLVVKLNEEYRATSIDISPQGIKLCTPWEVPMDTVLEIHSPKIEATGIAKFSSHGNGQTTLGIEFIEAFFSPAIFFYRRA